MVSKRLTDILNGQGGTFHKAWADTKAADELKPLPPDEYVCRTLSGELTKSKSKGTPGYQLTLEVVEGEFKGRRIWMDFWLTPAALAMTKRDLAKFGIADPTHLERQGNRILFAAKTGQDGEQVGRIPAGAQTLAA